MRIIILHNLWKILESATDMIMSGKTLPYPMTTYSISATITGTTRALSGCLCRLREQLRFVHFPSYKLSICTFSKMQYNYPHKTHKGLPRTPVTVLGWSDSKKYFDVDLEGCLHGSAIYSKISIKVLLFSFLTLKLNAEGRNSWRNPQVKNWQAF
jgi:hypothetical protein